MEKNFFEELREKKANLLQLALKAKQHAWIDEERYQEIVKKVEGDVLTIGVIGQMKCGKSTFLNSFIFEEEVLPAATTPMTAALSVITYGAEKKIVAEFYTPDEWEEQKLQASRNLSDVEGNPLEESKVKAAKELVEKSAKLGSSLEGFLGKTQTDSFDKLEEYVGAEGKYISITKAVTIYYPKDYLKGVEIVDTPGFNDPIVSREERTKKFLQKADVVLLMLYAGRPFDATDREILFKNVSQCGTGKVLIAINKYDIPFAQGDTEDEIRNYVKEELRKACRESNDNSLIEILQTSEPITFSAQMALLSQLPLSKISGDEDLNFAWKRLCDDFEISSQSQMREKSHLDILTSAVKKIVETEKAEILFKKPYNAIVAAGNNKKRMVENKLRECNAEIETSSQPDDELEERLSKISKAKSRLDRKINSLGDGIDGLLRETVRKGRNNLEDHVEEACKRMDKAIDNLGRFKSADSVKPIIEREFQTLITKTLKREVEQIGNTAKNNIVEHVNEFIDNANDILMRYLPDIDTKDFVEGVEHDIYFEINDKSAFTYNNGEGLYGFFFELQNGASRGLMGALENALSAEKKKAKLHSVVNEISNTDVTGFLETIFERKDEVIEKVKTRFIDELLTPIEEMVTDVLNNKSEREARLKEKQAELEILKKEEAMIAGQFKELGLE